NVGRLHFDTPDEYRAYAEHVVAYETEASVAHRKRAAIFATRNDGDRATGMLHNQVALPIVTGAAGVRALQGYGGFQLDCLLADSATRARLISLISGREPGGVPAFLFTGSHGASFRIDDPQQREKQGALVCQDWPGFGRLASEHMLAASDIPADATLHGLIH